MNVFTITIESVTKRVRRRTRLCNWDWKRAWFQFVFGGWCVDNLLLASICMFASTIALLQEFGRVIIFRGRILTGEDKSYSSSFLHGNNLSMNVIPNWVFQSFCVSLRLTELFNSSRQGRVLYCVSFVTIVLGLGWVRRCDSSACKGIDAFTLRLSSYCSTGHFK